MSAHQHTLAQSQRYRIYHEFDAIFLDTPDRKGIVIGDFYGDPAAAIIDHDERWCAIVGCGITLYYLRSPFQPYQIDARSPQWATFHSSATDAWWVISLEQTGPCHVRFSLDPYGEVVGTYELHSQTQTISAIATAHPNAF